LRRSVDSQLVFEAIPRLLDRIYGFLLVYSSGDKRLQSDARLAAKSTTAE
jgi:hypothetical protein